ncbi:MAG: oligosaccharide flippase family protein [Candidatus Woesearchaeota archaeon]
MIGLINMVRRDRMLASSSQLIAASAITSVLGFAFWIICARLYSPQEVGIAASLISGMALITTLTVFGFDYGIIKYKAKNLASSCTMTAAIATIVCAAIFAGMTYDKLLGSSAALVGFVVLSGIWTAFYLNDSIYIAMHSSRNVLIKQTVFAVLKLSLPLALISLGSYGIFLSWTIAAGISLVAILVYRPLQWSFHLDIPAIRQIFKFSIVNYLSSIAARGRELLIPIIITFYAGASSTAYYYLSFNIVLVFLLVPKQIAKAMLAEEKVESKAIKKALILTLLASLSAVCLVFIAGKYLLLLYGAKYAEEGLTILKIFSVAGVFAGVTEVYYGVMRSEHNLRLLVTAQCANAALTILLAVALIHYGIMGVVMAWLASELLTNSYVIYKYRLQNPIRVLLQ